MEHKLYIAWQAHDSRRWHSIGVLRHQPGTGYEFGYIRGAYSARDKDGFTGISSFPDFEEVYRSEQLFAFFSNRILSSSRAEYAELIEQVGLQPLGDKQSPEYVFNFLRRTQGWRATDSFEIFAPVDTAGSEYCWEFFTRGLSHTPDEIRLRWTTHEPQGVLQIATIKNNPHDPDALIILDQEQASLGYVPRNYSATIRAIIEAAAHVELRILRHNKREDLDQKRFLLRLSARMPADFQLPHFEEFEPLADGDRTVA